MLGKTESRRRGDRGWDGGMASPTQRTWAWASSGRQQRTGKPGVLQSMKSQSDMTEWMNNKTAVKINKLELYMLTRICIFNIQPLEWRKGFLGLFSSIYHFIWDRTIWNQSIKKGEDGYVLWMVSETSLWMTQKRIKIKKHEWSLRHSKESNIFSMFIFYQDWLTL